MAGKSNGQQKKQQIFFRLTAFAGRRWRLVFSFESSGQVSSTNSNLSLILFYTTGRIGLEIAEL